MSLKIKQNVEENDAEAAEARRRKRRRTFNISYWVCGAENKKINKVVENQPQYEM